jgi:hypothetical protein
VTHAQGCICTTSAKLQPQYYSPRCTDGYCAAATDSCVQCIPQVWGTADRRQNLNTTSVIRGFFYQSNHPIADNFYSTLASTVGLSNKSNHHEFTISSNRASQSLDTDSEAQCTNQETYRFDICHDGCRQCVTSLAAFLLGMVPVFVISQRGFTKQSILSSLLF